MLSHCFVMVYLASITDQLKQVSLDAPPGLALVPPPRRRHVRIAPRAMQHNPMTKFWR